MGYTEALEAAGATVHRFEEYGAYHGVWMAHVTLPDGCEGFILDYYGSCSGCDAYVGSFGYSGSDDTPTEKLVEFGASYFAQILTREEALAKCAESADFNPDYRDLALDITRSTISEAP